MWLLRYLTEPWSLTFLFPKFIADSDEKLSLLDSRSSLLSFPNPNHVITKTGKHLEVSKLWFGSRFCVLQTGGQEAIAKFSMPQLIGRGWAWRQPLLVLWRGTESLPEALSTVTGMELPYGTWGVVLCYFGHRSAGQCSASPRPVFTRSLWPSEWVPCTVYLHSVFPHPFPVQLAVGSPPHQSVLIWPACRL